MHLLNVAQSSVYLSEGRTLIGGSVPTVQHQLPYLRGESKPGGFGQPQAILRHLVACGSGHARECAEYVLSIYLCVTCSKLVCACMRSTQCISIRVHGWVAK